MLMQVQRWVLLVVAVVVWAIPTLGADSADAARPDTVAPAADPRKDATSDSAKREASRDSDGEESAPTADAPAQVSVADEEAEDATSADDSGKRAAPVGADLLAVVKGRGATTSVTDTSELERALAAARPGDTIRMAAGTYEPVVINRSGTASAPLTLTGPQGAVISGSGKGYTVHLHGAS